MSDRLSPSQTRLSPGQGAINEFDLLITSTQSTFPFINDDLYGNNYTVELPRSRLSLSRALSPIASPDCEVINLDTRDHEGKTQLHHAVIRGAQKEVKELLSKGAAVDIQDTFGNQPLHYAASKVSYAIIELLLKWDADVNAIGADASTATHLAIRSPKALQALFRARPCLSAQDTHGDTPLHLAVLTSSSCVSTKGSIIEKLIHLGADVNLPNHSGSTPFHLVLHQQYSNSRVWNQLVMMFLENNADISSSTSDNVSPFQILLDRSDSRTRPESSVVKGFLHKGADPNTRLISGELILYFAFSQFNDSELWNTLCYSADIDEPSIDGDLPLHVGLKHIWSCGSSSPPYFVGHVKHLEILLDRHADPNQRNQGRQSPLFVLLTHSPNHNAKFDIAIRPALELLLKYGADVMQGNAIGDFPIYLAIRNFSGERQYILIERLLDSCLRRDDETSDLHLGCRDDCKWLLDYYTSRRRKRWNTLIQLVIPPKDMPANVAEILPGKLITLAAEEFLESSKAEFVELKGKFGLQHENTRFKRDYIVTILRDCLSLKLDIKPNWYHSLLDFFD